MKEENVLRYSARVGDCFNLGPYRRAVLWVHGCCFHCAGCIASGFTDEAAEYFEETPEEMAEWYLSQRDCEGMTISGGEPMLQAGLLADMIDAIRSRISAGFIVYTGFLYEVILEHAAHDEGMRRFLERIDLLIDGPYIRELDVGQPYQGSTNQRMIQLSERYADALKEYYAARPGRNIELRFEQNRILLVGIPSADQAEIWKNIKRMGEGADE